MIWHERTYRNGPYEVHVGPNGEIRVRPGDTLWGYSVAIYGNYYNINKFARFQGNLLLPVKKTDKIIAGETIYHIETYLYGPSAPAMTVLAKPRAQIQTPPTPGGEEKARITVDWIIDKHPELASKRGALANVVKMVGVDNGAEVNKLVECLKAVGKFVKLFKDMTPLSGFLTAVGLPMEIAGILDRIGKFNLLGVRFFGHKAYAYGVTCWAFSSPPPPAPATDLQKIRNWCGSEYREERAKEQWVKMRDAAIKAMSDACTGEGVPTKYGKILLRAHYENDPKKLAQAIYASFESSLSAYDQEAHRKLPCDYPN